MPKDLLEQLTEYSKNDYVPMHMPGAKRNTAMFHMNNPYGLDITEIDGFDNMHHAQGILSAAFQRAARLFGADETLFLVNGSSAGILSAVCGATHKRDTVIAARNCHSAVYNALYINELNPVYIYPKPYDAADIKTGICGAIDSRQIAEALEMHPETAAVIVTSPTYEGNVSDIAAIAEVVHRYDAVFIVDEAHGAHFNFSPAFPQSAVKCGADAVIQSIHKTLPAFTQTALLHLNGTRIDRERVKMYWDMYQTTSPSYILMAGIDRCMTILEQDADVLFEQYIKRLKALREKLADLKNIHLVPVDDISKIVLAVEDGKCLYDLLREKYHIQVEMASAKYVIAMTSIGDTDEYYERFLNALTKLDKTFSADNGQLLQISCNAQVMLNIYDAVNRPHELVRLSDAVSRISAAKVCIYPPGIPVVNPGEQITEQAAAAIRAGLTCGLEVIGVSAGESRTETQTAKHTEKQKEEVQILCLK